MGQVTAITPVGPKHKDILSRAVLSVRNQTVPVYKHIITHDDEGRGPGYLRNRMLAQVKTEFVVFLDADDWLEPNFVERTLATQSDGRHVYTGWYEDNNIRHPPERAWCGGTWHLVTTLMPTNLARRVGGFDEELIGMEDTDFYLKILRFGVCGISLDEPLVHYQSGGGRGKAIHDSGEVKILQGMLSQRYGGMKMGCCGDGTVLSDAPIGERQPGDVLCMAMWHGNRKEMGRATGRRYPRMSYPRTCWVDPRDVRVSSNLWQRISDAPIPQEVHGVDGVAEAMEDMGMMPKKMIITPAIAHAQNSQPNFEGVRQLARRSYESQPIFVKSTKDYPSYCDFWRLVELSGFDVTTSNNIDLKNENVTYIFVVPDGVPNCSKAKARCIFWQLEYAGDYTNQKNRETIAEKWSSEPAHARRTDSKYVLLGSHPALANSLSVYEEYQHDVAMLAYMVPRRERIKKQLDGVRLAPDYPGHCDQGRHEVLCGSKMMLQVNQHDEAALAPLRFALAAAYRLPIIAETVPDPGAYGRLCVFADYDLLVPTVKLALQGTVPLDGIELYDYLCVEHTFRKCVEGALGT